MTETQRIPAATLTAAALAGLCAAPLLLGACGAPVGNQDAMRAVERGEVGLPVLSLRWKREISDHTFEPIPQEFASAAVHAGRVYVGSQGGTFYALSSDDGSVQWKVPLGAVSSKPVIDRGRIYVGTDDGTMVCLDAFDGAVRWRYATRGPVLEPPVLHGDMLFFSNEADHVYALEAATGTFKWLYKTETPEEYTLRGHAGVTVDEDLVFTGFANGTLVALRAGTGSVAWLTSLKGEGERFIDVDGTPHVRGQMVYVTSSSGGVFALDKTTGLILWRRPMEGAGGLALDEQRLYVAAANTGIHALDFAGHIIWRQGTRGGGEPAEPIVSETYLLYTLSEDGVFIADPATGELYQYFDPGHGISSMPTLERDRMYVLSNRGVLYAMGVDTFE